MNATARAGHMPSARPVGATERSYAMAPHRALMQASPLPPIAGGLLAGLAGMWHPLHALLILGAMVVGALDIWSGSQLAEKRGAYSHDQHERGLTLKLLKASQVILAAMIDSVLVASGAVDWALFTACFLGWFVASEGQSYRRNLRLLEVEVWDGFDAADRQLTGRLSVSAAADDQVKP